MKAFLSSITLGAVIVMILLGPILLSADPMATDAEAQFQPPNARHPLGTDLLGRDVLSRLVYGGRQTLLITVMATLVATSLGALIGSVAGFVKATWLNRVVMVVVNAMLAIPGLVIALVVLTLTGRGILPMILALSLSQIAPVALVIRSAVQTVRHAGYIEAAVSMGARPLTTLWRHVLPNIRPTLFSYVCVIFSYVLLNGAALSFLGVGNEPGTPDWGVMLAEGRAAFRSAPWVSFAPGVAITVTVWAVNDLANQILLSNKRTVR